jgi:hypothetical protein
MKYGPILEEEFAGSQGGYMKQISKRQAMKILRSFRTDDHEKKWSAFREKNGKGDYGYDETFSFEGMPILKLSVSYYPPETKIYDLRL